MAEFVIHTRLDRSRFWLIVVLDVRDYGELPMVLDTAAPLTGISESTRDGLLKAGVLADLGHGRDLLRDVSV